MEEKVTSITTLILLFWSNCRFFRKILRKFDTVHHVPILKRAYSYAS